MAFISRCSMLCSASILKASSSRTSPPRCPSQKNGGISEDGLRWRIRLRDDVRWHDGAPFTAEDVKFTLELITNPKFRSWRTTGHSLLRDITVVSPREITWRMEEAFAPYLSFLTETFIVPKHILEKEADPNTAAFNQSPGRHRRLQVGQARCRRPSGACRESRTISAKVPTSISWSSSTSPTSRSSTLSSRVATSTSSVRVTSRLTITRRPVSCRIVLVTLVPRPSVEGIYLNLERPQFKELAVRQALYAAIDRKAILEALYYGVPSATETFMPRQSFYYNPSLPVQEFSVKQAREILDKAGWLPGRDGIRAKNGVRLSFTNSTTSGDHLREQLQQFLKQSLAEIGVEMTISNLPAAVIWGDFWGKSQFDTVIVGITYLIGADPDVTNRFHSRAIAAKGGRGSNNAQYVNPEVDSLLEKGARTFDPDERRAIYHKVQELIRRDLPFLPLYQSTAVHGRKSAVHGVVPNPNTRTESWNAASWYRAS